MPQTAVPRVRGRRPPDAGCEIGSIAPTSRTARRRRVGRHTGGSIKLAGMLRLARRCRLHGCRSEPLAWPGDVPWLDHRSWRGNDAGGDRPGQVQGEPVGVPRPRRPWRAAWTGLRPRRRSTGCRWPTAARARSTALVAATGGSFREATVTRPAGRTVLAPFGLLGDGRTAAIEMASASGLVLVPRDRRDPMVATTPGHGRTAPGGHRGRGAAGDRRHRRQRDQRRRRRARPGAGLSPARRRGPRPRTRRRRAWAGSTGSMPSGRDPRLDGVEVAVACDVDNPLCGPRGARPSTARRRGRRPRWSRCSTPTSRTSPRSSSATWASRSATSRAPAPPGAWAAAWSPSPSGRLEPGINLVIDAVDLAGRLEGADLCLTGEGAIDDSQRLRQDGRRRRPPGALAAAARRSPWPARSAPAPRRRSTEGLDAYFSICPGPDRPRRGHGPRRRAAGRGDGAGRPGVPGGADEEGSVRQASGMIGHSLGLRQRAVGGGWSRDETFVLTRRYGPGRPLRPVAPGGWGGWAQAGRYGRRRPQRGGPPMAGRRPLGAPPAGAGSSRHPGSVPRIRRSARTAQHPVLIAPGRDHVGDPFRQHRLGPVFARFGPILTLSAGPFTIVSSPRTTRIGAAPCNIWKIRI